MDWFQYSVYKVQWNTLKTIKERAALIRKVYRLLPLKWGQQPLEKNQILIIRLLSTWIAVANLDYVPTYILATVHSIRRQNYA